MGVVVSGFFLLMQVKQRMVQTALGLTTRHLGTVARILRGKLGE